MKRSIVDLPTCRLFIPEIVTVDVGGTNLVTDRTTAERILLALGVIPHNLHLFITGDPDAVDDEAIGPC
jgi:hypothetical protein